MTKIKSYCKINLFLKIIGKKGNFHNIQTLSFLVNHHDEISIIKTKNKDKINFFGKFNKSVKKNDNSLSKTLKILRNNKLLDSKKKYKIEINKKVPVFAGLGGGTSNAFFLVKHFLKKIPSPRIIKTLRKQIGSDYLIFENKQSFQSSLSKNNKTKKKFNFYFILVKPTFGCSTKKIYSQVKEYSKPTLINFSKIKTKKKMINLLKNEKNDLQNIVTMKHTSILKIINFLANQKGCHLSRMTGSGSVCYGLFDSLKDTKKAFKNVKKMYPNYWSTITKTI